MRSVQLDKKLPKKFYLEDSVKLAPKLLGKILVRKYNDIYLTGKIVEVEAYRGKDDQAAHSFNGRTPRTEVMFYEGGYLYVYFTYGMHYCANIVCDKYDVGAAILIRGVEPITGFEQLAINRYGKKQISQKEKLNLTSGPAKLCQAFNITKQENGTDLTEGEIYLTEGEILSKRQIIRTKRIGITKAIDFQWRFYVKDNPYVSKK